MTDKPIENVIIIGGACAGYTAAIYAARADLEPLVIEGFKWGGQLQGTTEVENFPGFPEGIMGPEMMNRFRAQAERFGARFITDDASRVELSDGGIQRVWVDDDEYRAKSVILAMGAEPKRLGIPGELELGGRGVSTCGVCDGAFFKDRDVVVIGGGDTAMEDSIFVSKYADKLTVLHRRNDFRASMVMQDRARETANIEFRTPFVPEEFVAGDDGTLDRIRVRNAETDEVSDIEVGGAFVAIGHIPGSALVAGQVDLHDNGYVKVEEPSTRTNLAGVFAIGDLVDFTYRQAVTAAGSGTRGALDAEWYLRDTPPTDEARIEQAEEAEAQVGRWADQPSARMLREDCAILGVATVRHLVGDHLGDGVDQRQVGERLREVAELPARSRLDLLGVEVERATHVEQVLAEV